MKQNMRCPGSAPIVGGAPVMGGAPMGSVPMPTMPPMGQYETCCQVVEPTVTCVPQQHHYHRVDHVIPVVVRNVHHHHTQHNYVVNRQESVESYRYDEYLAGPTVINQPTLYAQPTQAMAQMATQAPVTTQPAMMNQTAYMQQMVGQPAVTPQSTLTNQAPLMSQSLLDQMMGQSLI